MKMCLDKRPIMARSIVFVFLLVCTIADASSSTHDDPAVNGSSQRFSVISLNWHHVQIPLTIVLWIFVVIIAKIVFHLSQRLAAIFPDSALLIVLGLVIGCLIYACGMSSHEFHLNPDLFFLYLLPPIVLDAGYFMPSRAFLHNIVTILIFAVFGTLWNTLSIGLTLYYCQDWFSMEVGIVDIFLFAALISAVDPVAVLCVFEEIHVNELLYICVFGESLLNDAVTVVLYNMLGAFAEIEVANLLPVDFVAGFASFFVVALGGVFVGLVWAIITGFTTKHTNHLTVIQPLICLIFPYLAYLLSELVHISGILAIVTCGLVMKQYVKSNVTGKSLVTVNYFLKTLSSSCEAIIFMLLGLSTISEKHYWDTAFVAVTVVACLVFRFIGVFVLCSIVNWRRMAKIDYVDQFIMAYGGLRGAVAYGLVMAIDARVVPAKEMYVTATIAVILFTVFVQGLSIKPMVYWLHVKLEQTEKTKTVTERMFDNMQDHVLVGMEEIIGYRGHHWFKNTFDNMNSRYIEPHVCRTPRTKGAKIMETHETLNVEEALRQLRKYGGHVRPEGPDFARSEAAQQANEMLTHTSSAAARDGMPPPESLPPMSVKKSGGMPKVTSLRTLLRETLPPAADIRRYSRHLLDEDVDSTSMNPRMVRQRALRSIEEEEEMAERTSPLRIRNGRLAPPPIRGPPDSPLPYQGQSVDDSVFDDVSDGELIPISGALRHYPGSDVPVLPVFFVRRDTMSRRTPRSQSERHPARVMKAATIATSDAVDETADNFVTARTSQNTGRVFQRNAKSVDPGEMSSLISQKSNSDVEEDHSSSKDNEEESPL